MKIKLLLLLSVCFISLSIQSCTSISASTVTMEESLNQVEDYMATTGDTLLNNVQAKIDQAFISSIMSNDMTALSKIYTDLDKLNTQNPNSLINYWMAYTAYQEAIWAQNQIGWEYTFMGKIAQTCLSVFEECEPLVRRGKQKVDGFVWGVRVLECILNLVIQRWEEWNNGVHGNSK